MLKKIKAAKRRTVQRNLERMGKAEGIKDPEYDEALKNFKDVEEKLSKMQSLLKDSLSVSKQFTARQAALGSHVAAYFAGDMGGELPLSSHAQDLAQAHTNLHCQVMPCLSNTLTEDFAKHVQEILSEEFPALRKEIHHHDGIRTDLESYRRRVKNLQEKGKPGNDPDLIKFSEKLARTQSLYTDMHADLMSKLRSVHDTRHSMMSSDFMTLLASQLAFHRRLADALGTIVGNIPSNDAMNMCSTIDERIAATPFDATMKSRDSGHSFAGSITGRLRGFSLTKKKRSGSLPARASSSGTPPTSSTPPIAESLPVSDAAYSDMFGDAGNRASLASEASAVGGTFPPPPGMSDSFHGIQSAAAAGAPPPPKREEDEDNSNKVVALFNYQGTDEDDLSFVKGDEIEIVEKIDEGWWRGKLANGTLGLFPSNYVSNVQL